MYVNDLEQVIQTYLNNNEEEFDNINLPISSPYYSHEMFVETLLNKKDDFCILSLNCQSLNAKFDKLSLLIEELRQGNFEFSVICLQETWLRDEADLSLLQIPNYTCISQGFRCSRHGGLVIYVNHQYKYEICSLIIQSNFWEGLSIKIITHENQKNIIINNIYRPPLGNLNNETLNKFSDELSILINELSSTNLLNVLLGDFNIDLLKLRNQNGIKDYLYSMISQGMYPLKTLPTRLSDNSASLIDNIFSNNSMQ